MPPTATGLPEGRPRSRATRAAGVRGARVHPSLVELPEAVADAVHRQEITRHRRIRLELASDVLHVRVDRSLVRLERDTVCGVEQLRAREHTTGLPRHRGHELELGRSQIDDALRNGHAHAGKVERHVSDAEDLGLGRPALGAAKHGAHAGYELFWAERLRDVIVRTDLQPDELVRFFAPAGQHHDWNVRLSAEGARDVEAIELRKTEIEHDEVWSLPARARERGRTVMRHDHRKTGMLQVVASELHDLGLVIDDQNLLHPVANPR